MVTWWPSGKTDSREAPVSNTSREIAASLARSASRRGNWSAWEHPGEAPQPRRNLWQVATNAARNKAAPDQNLALAAWLEANGVTDSVAGSFGSSSVFELAPNLLIQPGKTASQLGNHEPKLARNLLTQPLSMVRKLGGAPQQQSQAKAVLASPLNLGRGPLLLWFMAVMLFALQAYEMTLRAHGAPTWTTLAGLMLGIVIVGGLMQALGWRIAMSLSQASFLELRAVVKLGMISGIGLALAAGTGLSLLGLALGAPSAGLVSLALSCGALTLLLLLTGVLALLEQALLSGAIVTAVVALAIAIEKIFPDPRLDLPVFIGGYLLVVAALSGLIVYALRRFEKYGTPKATRYQPPVGQLLYRAMPFLCYGVLSVQYVIIGQYIGQVGRRPLDMTEDTVLAVLAAVHLLGLAAMVLTQGITEFALRSFWSTIRAAGNITLADRATLRMLVASQLQRHLTMLVVAQVVVSVAVGFVAIWAWQRFNLAPVWGELMPNLLIGSLVAYGLLAWGFFGCSFLITFSQPWTAVRALAVAISVQVVAGVACALLFGFQAAIIGSVAGAAVLVVLAMRGFFSILPKVDYAIYSAF